MTGQCPHPICTSSCTCVFITNSSCADSGLQVSELIPRLGCIKSHSREDATSARLQPDAGEAAVQCQHKHHTQKTTCQTVQLVSTHHLWWLAKAGATRGKLHSGNKYFTQYLKQKQCYLCSRWKLHFVQNSLRVVLVTQPLLIYCSSATTKMKIISQKLSRPFPPRVQESQDRPAHWTNRYNRPFTHRYRIHSHAHKYTHTQTDT